MTPASTGQNAPFFVDTEVLRLSKNGIWMSDETEITHEPTRKLFSRSLAKDEKGYFLKIGRETKRVEIEDTAYFIERLKGSTHTQFQMEISDGTLETLEPKTLTYRPGRLVCRIKGGTEVAKFLHVPYFDLLKNLEEDDHAYYLKFDKLRVELAKKD